MRQVWLFLSWFLLSTGLLFSTSCAFTTMQVTENPNGSVDVTQHKTSVHLVGDDTSEIITWRCVSYDQEAKAGKGCKALAQQYFGSPGMVKSVGGGAAIGAGIGAAGSGDTNVSSNNAATASGANRVYKPRRKY